MIRRKHPAIVLFFATLFYSFASATAFSADWPTWRYDANRSAASPAELPARLHLQWKRELPPPRPAFPDDLRLCFDASYEPVVIANTMFVPSMVTDSVAALDTDTGAEKWKFFADAPVRFAPVAWRGKVYFVSDDAYLYCLNADTGELLWKFSGAPTGREAYKFLGNERLISRWPARGGPVLADGIIYFAAGVWPFEGVYVCAVNAETGELLWRNDQCSLIKDGLIDHGARRDTGISPCGYLAVIGEKLIVPSGRSLPGFFDPKSGKMEPYTTGWGGRAGLAKGCWWVCGASEYFFQSGDMHSLKPRPSFISESPEPKGLLSLEDFAQLADVSLETVRAWIERGWAQTVERGGKRFIRLLERNRASYVALTKLTREGERHVVEAYPRLQLDSSNVGELGVFREPVVTSKTIYYSTPVNNKRGRGSHWPSRLTYTDIAAYDVTKAKWGLTCQGWLGRKRFLIPWRTLKFNQTWRLASEMKVHIKAGSRLYAGAPGVVAAIDIPAQGGRPKVSWKSKVEGAPSRILAADDKLFVVTREGAVYCFGGKGVQPKTYAMKKANAASPADEWATRASEILKQTSVAEGYCLALGIGTGMLIEELARQSALRVIVIDPDDAKVREFRRKMDAMGFYGVRVHVISGDLFSLRLPPCIFSLTVSEDLSGSGFAQGKALVEKLFDSMRPYGGVACLSITQEAHSNLAGWIEDVSRERNRGQRNRVFPKNSVSRSGDLTLLKRVAAPPGADEWTHESGNAGNRFGSRDQLAKPPFGVLWFGGSLDRAFPSWDYTHARGPFPLIAYGRLFMLVENKLHAADIYTGRHLWQASLPQSSKTKGRRRSHMIYQRDTAENFAAAEDGLYVVCGDACLWLDPATGSKLGEIRIPNELSDDKRATWQEVRISGDYLIGAAGKYLLCTDRRSGKVLWKTRSERDRFSFAAGNGKVFCVDYYLPARRRRGESKTEESNISALNVQTGKVLWRTVAKVPPDTANEKTKQRFAPLKPYLTYCDVNDILLLTATRSMVGAYKGESGDALWTKNIPCRTLHNNYSGPEPPILLPNVLIAHSGERYDPRTGAPAAKPLWRGMNTETRGCNRAIANEHVVTLRDAHASYYELATGRHAFFRGIRSGCTNSLIPAGGLLNAPNFAHGCCCSAWPIFTSFALVNMPEAAAWTAGIKPLSWGMAKVKVKKELLAHWSFDDDDGKTAKDRTGKGNDGEIKGGTPVKGKIGSAIRFSGNKEYVEIGKPPSLTVANRPLTVMAWVKSDAKNGVVVCRGGAWTGYSLYLKDGAGKFAIHRRKDDPIYVAAGGKAIVGAWTHLAGVIRQNQIEVYVNGKLAGKATTPGYIPGGAGQGMEIGFDVGNSPGEITDYFKGMIDEVKVFSYGLSSEEVEKECESGK